MLWPVHWQWEFDWAVQSGAVSIALEVNNGRSCLVANFQTVSVTREMKVR
jgi:hypothetical protein